MMGPGATDRFVDLVSRPDVPLAEAALLIAAHHHPVDVDAQLRTLDGLGADAPHGDPDGLAHYLFVERGFAGNRADYGDPRNSFLDEVLQRRLGLPITLGVLMIEVGRRSGTELVGIGMPGHFLVGTAREPRRFFDPFNGGAELDLAACRARFAETRGTAPFLMRYLEPVGEHAILSRMLANLVRANVARSPRDAVWALRLWMRVPGLSDGERLDAAHLLGRLGAFGEAAAVLEALADGSSVARDATVEALRFRARTN